MKKFYYLLFLILFLTGCGTTVIVEKQPYNGILTKDSKKVCILPFPLYENLDPLSWININVTLFENLADSLLAHGLDPIPYESVLARLEKEGWLKIQTQRPKIHPSLQMILDDPEWTPYMKEEVFRAIKRNYKPVKIKLSRFSTLTEEKALELARKEKADFLVWGRISRYRIRPEETLNPFKIGFISFFIKTPSRFLYGAPKDNYGPWHEMSIGALYGAIIGANAKDPFEPPVYRYQGQGHPLFNPALEQISGDEHYETGNAIIWGLMGAGVGLLASHGGYAPEAVITLSISVYDIKAGHKIWTSRVKLKGVPDSVFASRAGDKLFEKVIEEAVAQLMARFWQDFENSSFPFKMVQNLP